MMTKETLKSPQIDILGLSKQYGHIQAVKNISFSAKKGDVLGFLGPNGAGKTTTMRMITGFIMPDSGMVTVNDIPLHSDPINVKKYFGFLPEGSPSYGDMTVRQFLNFICDIRQLWGNERHTAIDKVVSQTQLETVITQPIDALSKGFKRRVGLAQAFIHNPPILILDEPTDGLDPNQKHHMRQLLLSLADDKIIIVSTHILEEVTSMCNRAIILSQGRIVADTTPQKLEQQYTSLEKAFRQLTLSKDVQ